MILHSPKVQEMIEDLDIPVFVDYSSYESHPLGRTEWIKVYGAMLNKEKEAETNGLTEIVVAKHRNGATADISLVFEKQYSRFSDYYTGPENQNSGEGLRI